MALVLNRLPWLPAMLPPRGCGQTWENYLIPVLRAYSEDFASTCPQCHGKPVAPFYRRSPSVSGYEGGFWHLVTDDPPNPHDHDEAHRVLSEDRCRTIKWPRPTIEHIDSGVPLVWLERTYGRMRTHVLLRDVSYLVVLEENVNVVYLTTAYRVIRKHTLEQLLDRYKQYGRP
jgi:hypothetical protein